MLNEHLRRDSHPRAHGRAVESYADARIARAVGSSFLPYPIHSQDGRERAAALRVRHAHRVRPRDRRNRRERGQPRPARRQPFVGAQIQLARSTTIIREGSGYWKYIPARDGIVFLTGYDYSTRFGRPGILFDRAIFRPLMGWPRRGASIACVSGSNRALIRGSRFARRSFTQPREQASRSSLRITGSSRSCSDTTRTNWRCSATRAFHPTSRVPP